MATYLPKVDGLIKDRKWFLIDAKGVVLGKLAAHAATILSGKKKAVYTPFLDTGDHVIVVNAAQIQVTGRKEQEKVYHRHTGYVGGLRSATVEETRRKHPTRLIEDAVRGMLPKTKLGRAMFLKLKVYAGESHPHQAQKPQPFAVK